MKSYTTYFYWLAFALALVACKAKTKTASSPKGNVPNAHTASLPFQEKFFEAERYKALGNISMAYKAFMECRGIDPNNAAVNYELARIEQEKNNNLPAATDYAQRAVNLNKENPWYHLLLAELWRDQGKYSAAAKEYREVHRLNPDDPAALFELAGALLYDQKYDEAIKTYDEIEGENGISEDLSFQKHQLYMQLKQTEKAGNELEKLAEAYPEEARYWGVVAQFYQQNNQPEKASMALEKMVKADPENGQVHYQLSEYYAAKGDEKKSYEELRAAFQTKDITIDQKVAVLLKYFNLTNMNPAYNAQAYELLDITERMHSNEAKAHSIYGDFLYRDRRDEEALKKYSKAVELDPSKSMIWMQLVVIEGGLRKFDLLEKDSKRAMELFPSLPDFYYYHGIALDQLKRFNEAVESFNLGKELVVDNNAFLVQFYSALGSAYHELKDHARSDEAFDQALALDPDNALVLNNYAYYLSLRKAKLEKAAAMGKKANELNPNEATFEDTYAWVLFELKRYEEAKEWMEKCLAHGGSGAEVYEHYGDILFRVADIAGALDAWKKSQAAGNNSEGIKQRIAQQKIAD